MPKVAKGQRYSVDLISNAGDVMAIVTGDIEDDAPADDGKDQAAAPLGKKGGVTRAARLSPQARAEIARMAASRRWSTNR